MQNTRQAREHKPCQSGKNWEKKQPEKSPGNAPKPARCSAINQIARKVGPIPGSDENLHATDNPPFTKGWL